MFYVYHVTFPLYSNILLSIRPDAVPSPQPSDTDSTSKQLLDETNTRHSPDQRTVNIIRTILSWVLSIGLYTLFVGLFISRMSAGNRTSVFVRVDFNSWVILPWIIIFGSIGQDDMLPTLVIKLCTFLGDISYSFYLLHDPILGYASQAAIKLSGNPGFWYQFTSYWAVLRRAIWLLILIIPLSWEAYHKFEMPAQKWLRSKLLPPPAPPLSQSPLPLEDAPKV